MEKFMHIFSDRRMFIVFALGFSSGLPLLLTGGTLQGWLTAAGLSLTQLGLVNLIKLPYNFKFLWSPFLDRFVPPFLGRRRGWLIITQLGLIFGLFGMALCNPNEGAEWLVILAILVAFFSASQDIVIDAHRREILPANELGLGSSLYTVGYRFGMMLANGGAFMMAEFLPWSVVYMIMAASMCVGLIVTLLAKEPEIEHAPPRNMREAIVEPLREYFSRKDAIWILVFILLYKVGDNLAAGIATPFYIKSGFTNLQIGAIVKTFGIWAIIVGGIVGGATMVYLGIRKSLWVFGILQALSTCGFALLAYLIPIIGPSNTALGIVISVENFTAGMGTAAFAAFMANLTNKRFTATQYALLTSFMGIPRDIIPGMSGWLAEQMGWIIFFNFCALIAIPGLLLIFKIGHWADGDPTANTVGDEPGDEMEAKVSAKA